MRNPLALLPRPRERTRIQTRASVPIAPRTVNRTTSSILTGQTFQQGASFREQGTVHSIVHRYAADVARLTYQVVSEGNSRGKFDEPQVVPNHPFTTKLLRKPNETMTRTKRAFLQLCGTWLELYGEATVLVVRAVGNGQPVELWPIHPKLLTPVTHPTRWLDGWIYTDPDGRPIPLRPDQIRQVKWADPDNPYRGISPMRAAMTDVDIALYTGDWERNFFLNSALPGGIVSTDLRLTSDEFAEWQRRWNEQHGGVERAHRVALLDAGGKFTAQQMSNTDMQLIELMEHSRENIREAFGISKTMLGLTESVNRATAEAAEYIYGRYSLSDRVDLWLEFGNELLADYPSTRELVGKGQNVHVEVVEELAPQDTAQKVADRNSRLNGFKAYCEKGADPAEAAEVWELPAVDFEAGKDDTEEAPAVPSPLTAPQQGPPLPPGQQQEQDEQDDTQQEEEDTTNT